MNTIEIASFIIQCISCLMLLSLVFLNVKKLPAELRAMKEYLKKIAEKINK